MAKELIAFGSLACVALVAAAAVRLTRPLEETALDEAPAPTGPD